MSSAVRPPVPRKSVTMRPRLESSSCFLSIDIHREARYARIKSRHRFCTGHGISRTHTQGTCANPATPVQSCSFLAKAHDYHETEAAYDLLDTQNAACLSSQTRQGTDRR